MTIIIKNTPDLILETFDYLNTPVFIVDSGLDKIVALNASVSFIFQYSAVDILDHDIRELIISCAVSRDLNDEHTPEYGPISNVLDEKYYGNILEAVCRKKNGDLFSANVSIIPCSTDNQRLVVIQDISTQKKIQQKACQRTKELSIFTSFAKILTSHKNSDAIMQETISMLLSIMGADSGWIYLMDDKAGNLHLKAYQGFNPHFIENVRTLNVGECFNGKVFASGRPLLVKKSSEDPRVIYRDNNMVSMISVPISSRGEVLGVLGISSQEASYFTSMDIQLLSPIGSQLGVAIENTRLIAELRSKMEQIELISELSGIINSSLSIGTIFRMMVSEIRKIIAYDRASLLLYNETENNLLIFALDTNMNTVLKKGIKAPIDNTSAGWVIKNNKPWINYDLEKSVFSQDKKLLREGILSTISIPLSHDRMLGVFNLDSTEVSKYSEHDLRILLPIAKHISIALENALLFDEISRDKKEWEKTFDAITDMVWTEDGKQRILRANQALLIKTGLSSMEVAGKYCRELLCKIGINSKDCLCSDTVAYKRPSFRELKGTGGNIFHFWAYPLIDEEGRLYAIVHYLKDVTAQKRLEQQLIRADKLASLGTLVAGIAHEINNPLGIIAGYSEALLERSKEKTLLDNRQFEDFPEYLDTIHKEIFRCKGILKSLLDFARSSGGTFREIDINELIKEVILLVNNKAIKLNHTIDLQLNRDLPKICADPGKLRQLFMNIIINSIYFTPEGGGIFLVTEMDSNSQDGDMIKVSVSDTGSGIPEEIIDKVFDPFFTTKPPGDGTGLGLAICHKIIEEHHGTIDVENEKDKGIKFIIRIPARAQDDTSSCS
ncbi:MAG: GAF domain-containing protein [Nitrospirota bacterium]